VLDNERYGETGGQTSHTSSAADLVGVAKACGIADSRAITTMAEVEALVPKLARSQKRPEIRQREESTAPNIERILPMQDGTLYRHRIALAGISPI